VRIALAILCLPGIVHAGTIRGTVTLPVETRTVDTRDGHWRVDNGVLPVGPRWPDPRSDVVVVLESEKSPPKKGADDKSPTINMELHGLRLDPRVLVVPVGANVAFKNSDRVPHTLYLENAATLLGPESQPAGQTRSVRLLTSAEYAVRDQEYPHIEGTIVAVESPYAAQVDEKGGFKLEAPEGKYRLKVYWHGEWNTLMETLEVGPKTTDISLTVPAPKAHAAGKGRAE
jgi:hypothetical protein